LFGAARATHRAQFGEQGAALLASLAPTLKRDFQAEAAGDAAPRVEVPKAARQFPPLERNAATDFGAALLARLCACTTLASAPPFCGCSAGMAAADWRAQVRQALLRGIRQLCSECVAAGDGWMATPELYLAAVAMLTAVLLRRSGFLVQVGGAELTGAFSFSFSLFFFFFFFFFFFY
jgi:hypothetical protein